MGDVENMDELTEVGEDFVDVEEEDDKKKVLRNAGDPTLEDYKAHRTDQMPYRSWCPHFVNGRATGHQHRSQKEVWRIPQLGLTTCTAQNPSHLHLGMRRQSRFSLRSATSPNAFSCMLHPEKIRSSSVRCGETRARCHVAGPHETSPTMQYTTLP